MDKLIITAALTGAITVPTQTPHLPLTPEEIARDGVACAEAGATAVHIHAREPQDGHPSSDPGIVRDIAARIKERSGVIIGVTTGGGMGMTPQDRLRAARDLRPELASFNLGSINFSMHPVARRYEKDQYRHPWEEEYVQGTKDFIFRNTFGDMEVFAQTLREQHVTPEYEAYDVGHLYNLKFLERTGAVQGPFWIQFVLGVLGGLAATPETLLMMIQTADRLFGPGNYRWSVIGVGYPAAFHMASMAIMLGGHVRIGLEDNVFIRRGVLATNPELVEKVVRLAAEYERPLATPDEARALLGLKGLEAVNY